MKTSTSEREHRKQRTAQNKLDDLNFTVDLVLASHTHEQIQTKTTNEAAASASIGRNIHNGKSKILKYNTENTRQITLDGETLEDVETPTYQGSIIDEQGGSDANVKARTAFIQLKNIWNPKQMSTNVKCTIFNTNIRTVLLNEVGTWRTTTNIVKKVQVFINSCLRKILIIL